MLKPLDIVIAASMVTLPPVVRKTFAELADLFETSPATTHRAVRRLVDARLLRPRRRSARTPADYGIDVGGLTEVLVYGVRYFVPARLGAPAMGLPTAHTGPDLADRIRSETPYVWPLMDGAVHGVAIEPLHHAVPTIAAAHQAFYRVLALTDAARVGRARERALAGQLLPAVLAEAVRDHG